MTAEEIRSIDTVSLDNLEAFHMLAFVLREGVAQLAELNQTLSSIIGQVGPTAMGIYTCDLGRRE